jgi:DNA-binding beta-propeller fold protein YncE
MLTTIVFLLAAALDLPGGPPVGMDYLAYDPGTNRIWVPAGNTAAVDVLDVATGKVTAIGGFATAPARRPGRPRTGPSSATVGDGVVWIGNRADNRLSAYDARSLAPAAACQLSSMPDGLAYVRTTREVWVTTPGDQSITIVGVSGKTAAVRATVRLRGEPEGYAVDDARGLFFTNLEDKDRTLAIDIRARKVVGDWPASCGAAGPRGLAIDRTHGWLFVACTNGAVAVDVEHGGKMLGRLETGGGVDNLDYDPRRQTLFVASSAAGDMTIARVDGRGVPQKARVVPTARGARNPILDGQGRAYVEDAAGGRLLIVEPDAH